MVDTGAPLAPGEIALCDRNGGYVTRVQVGFAMTYLAIRWNGRIFVRSPSGTYIEANMLVVDEPAR